MAKIMKKIVNACLLVCLIVMISATTVFATIAVYGSEKAGYLVESTQLRKKTNTFDDYALNKKYKSYMTYGAKVWKESGVVTFKRSRNTPNTVETCTSKDTSFVAYAVTWGEVRTGKIIKFEIKLNKDIMNGRTASRNKVTAAHEMGHTLGLLDLYEARNKGKLMYGFTDRETTKPTATDIKGGKYATRK